MPCCNESFLAHWSLWKKAPDSLVALLQRRILLPGRPIITADEWTEVVFKLVGSAKNCIACAIRFIFENREYSTGRTSLRGGGYVRQWLPPCCAHCGLTVDPRTRTARWYSRTPKDLTVLCRHIVSLDTQPKHYNTGSTLKRSSDHDQLCIASIAVATTY